MRKITDYPTICRLLKSANFDDVRIGIELLRKEKFTSKELLYNFPNDCVVSRDFNRNMDAEPIGYAIFGTLDLIISGSYIYAVGNRTEKQRKSRTWYSTEI